MNVFRCGALVAAMLSMASCCCRPAPNTGASDSSGSALDPRANDLDAMETARISVSGVEFEVWIARTDEQRNKGLMFIKADQMVPLEDGTERGMLFVFEKEKVLGFWMRNTIIPLDIAYARTDGTIVKTHTMTPLSDHSYSSRDPARYALELNAGVLSAKEIGEGEVVVIPDTVPNPTE